MLLTPVRSSYSIFDNGIIDVFLINKQNCFSRKTEKATSEEEIALQDKQLSMIKIENGDAKLLNGTTKENGTVSVNGEYKDEISWKH